MFYYDGGPRQPDGGLNSAYGPPLVCVGGLAEAGACFYKQIMALGSLGFRVVALTLPPVSDMEELGRIVIGLLDALGIVSAVLLGSGMGGFVVQVAARLSPAHVAGLVLVNTFVDLGHFSGDLTCVPLISFMPDLIIRKKLLARLPSTELEPGIRDSVDFVVSTSESLSRSMLVARCRALASDYSLDGPVPTPQSAILVIDAMDDVAVPDRAREEVSLFYPQARVAELKDGGNFPHLSRASEVHMHIKLLYRATEWDPVPTEQMTPLAVSPSSKRRGKSSRPRPKVSAADVQALDGGVDGDPRYGEAPIVARSFDPNLDSFDSYEDQDEDPSAYF